MDRKHVSGCQAFGGKGMWGDCLMGMNFGVMKNFRNYIVVMVAQNVNVLNTTDLYILKELKVNFVYLTTIFLFWKTYIGILELDHNLNPGSVTTELCDLRHVPYFYGLVLL